MKLLLDAGASTKSILRLAIGSGDRGILYHVRAAGATLDDADLIIAVKYGLVALVSKCLAAGANPNSARSLPPYLVSPSTTVITQS